MKCLHIFFAISTFFILSSNAFSQDQEVNCENEVVDEVPVWYGYASCMVQIDSYTYEELSAYVEVSPTPQIQLFHPEYFTKYCWADVPYFTTQPIVERTCEYTPEANFSLSEISGGYANLTDKSTDRDGNIVRWELWIDGVKKADTNESISTGWWVDAPTYVTVKIKVTDNDGHSHSKTKKRYFTGYDSCTANPSAPHCY